MIPSLTHLLKPNITELLGRAQSDLRLGLPVLIINQNARALVMAVETLSNERLQRLRGHFAEPELVLTANRGQAVMATQGLDGGFADPVRIQPPALADVTWFRRLADTRLDETSPIGPLHLVRTGETALHDFALTLIKSAELLPAAVAFFLQDTAPFPLDVPNIALDDARQHLATAPILSRVAQARLPIETHETGQLHIFRAPDGVTEHYAMEVGTPDFSRPVLCRVHSACFTGDVLGSLKCDCGPQLREALARMGSEGSGLLLYLNQEGRGIGLANKMRVYSLQSKGFDTVEANHRLGFEDDERDFRTAAVMLDTLGVDAIRLLTNNPKKVDTLRRQGVQVVERLPLRVGENQYNQHYLSIKALKSGHAL